MLKYSRQRECIKNFLLNRYDHPTAETVYLGIKEEFPNISLGTVYRNLSLLAELGEIIKISTSGPDRFDGHTEPHYHFFCDSCGQVMDLNMDSVDHVNLLAEHNFEGHVERSVIHFYGQCPACLKRQISEKNS
ncbi:MAG: transcriptional repressor [Lachnospiraceae bacterium]|nr:transcriptional repressor [Lachnospiraceae bacterium]